MIFPKIVAIIPGGPTKLFSSKEFKIKRLSFFFIRNFQKSLATSYVLCFLPTSEKAKKGPSFPKHFVQTPADLRYVIFKQNTKMFSHKNAVCF